MFPILVLLIYISHLVSGTCFFPVEFQGIFSTQSALSRTNSHLYSEITILPDGIPAWGVCQRRMGNTVILHDSTGGHHCMRCFHLYLRSPNVIQVYTEGLDRCYDSDSDASASCPSMQDIRSLRAREIMLYKSRSFSQDGRISRVMCPFVGRFHFSYGAFDGKRRSDMCLDLSSHLSSCPRASQLKLNFRSCTFGDLDLSLECLGSWVGFDDITYLALYDPSVSTDQQPKYRCAMYHMSESGRISLSFSVDSSCHHQLVSPWQGFESLNLTPVNAPSPPASVYGKTCTFPEWMQGEWQDITITGEKLEFRDESTDQFSSSVCLSQETAEGEKFSLYSVNQCGEESFKCIWIKSRSENVMEFVMSSEEVQFNTTSLCSDERFWKYAWLTQGRKTRLNARCPISGEFVGVLPDDNNLCARLTSDCKSPHLMHYSVHPCKNESLPYEVTEHDFGDNDIGNVYDASRRRLKRDSRPTPPWTYLGASEQRNRFYILSSRPIHELLDPSSGPRVYVFEGPPLNDSEDRPVAGKLTADHLAKGVPSGESAMALLEPVAMASEPVAMATESQDLLRSRRQGYSVTPGDEKERYYQCLGQWDEGGVSYTYTWRRDVHKHECFAGVIVSEDEVFITEAGSTCRRGLQPLKNGMKIIKRNTCTELDAKRNYLRQLETNEISGGFDKSFGGRQGPRWNALGDTRLPFFSKASSLPNNFRSQFLLFSLVFKLLVV